ncbi:hypothetical protein [Vibrio sonorensis]|uniref:hypothetical protein n=1 Tax=Vibrio sonorensis TaxID=1004316 RepID=UPI0008DAC77A|nr:hypothetical protein [Vibrio sonorensis]
MKWITLILACISFTVAANKAPKESDLTQFDLPFLIGDWYLINPNPEESQENFLAIKLTLDSGFNFQIDIQKKDYSVDHWEGLYNANEDTIVLGVNSDEPQVYQYSANHHMLNLNGVIFTKALSNSLAGKWTSEQMKGDEQVVQDGHKMDLILQPDFVFLFRVSNETGDEAVHRGVYYTEDDHLVLLYENGEHDAKYTLNRDTLTIEMDDGEMFAVLNRIH